jgi:transcriptional regulator with XRE-family HTH domain
LTRRPQYDVSPMVQIGLDEIAAWFKLNRRQSGLRQRHLEKLASVDQTIISRLENGHLYSIRFLRLAALVGAVFDDRPPRDRWQ